MRRVVATASSVCLLLIVSCLGSLTCLGQESKPRPAASPSVAPDKAEWTLFSLPEGGFTVMMPGKPVDFSQPLDTPAGTLQTHIYVVDLPSAAYMVLYTDLPVAPDRVVGAQAVLDHARDKALVREKGKLLDDRVVSLDGYPGREFSIAAGIGGGVFIDRVYLVKTRLYTLSVLDTSADTGSSESKPWQKKDTRTFLDSFRLAQAQDKRSNP